MSYIKTGFSAIVGTVLSISHKRFMYLCFRLGSFHFALGGRGLDGNS